MKKNQKGKTAVIVTGILFAASLVFLIVVLILNFSSGKGGDGNAESNKETKPSAESVLNPQSDSKSSEENPSEEPNTDIKESQEGMQGQSESGIQGQSESGTQKQTESGEIKDSLSLHNGKNNESGEAQKQLEPYSENMKDLYLELSDYTEGISGDWAIYAEDLSDDSYMFIDKSDEKMPAASLIKLFIMAVVYEKIDEGVLTEEQSVPDYFNNTVSYTINQMITESSNEAANALIRLLADKAAGEDETAGTEKGFGGQGDEEEKGTDAAGRAAVNKWLSANGYYETNLGRMFLDTESKADNYTSVKDCAKLLKSIYNGECVSAEMSKKMESFLLGQTRNDKIPAGIQGALANGVKCGHKTGELWGEGYPVNAEHDVGIIYMEDKDYILCVMSANIDNGTAKNNIAEVSKTVYEYMTGAR